MSAILIIIGGFALLMFIGGVYATLFNPEEIDHEEEARVRRILAQRAG